MERLIKLLDKKILTHKLEITKADIEGVDTQTLLKQGLMQKENKSEAVALTAAELMKLKDRALFHKGAIAALEDIKHIISEAMERVNGK